MNIERFQQLLDAYGTHQDNWPEAERNAAQMLLVADAECRRRLHQHRDLDLYLDGYETRPPVGLYKKIHTGLPKALIDRMINWLIPEVGSNIWKPAVAGSLPLMLGIVLGASVLDNLLDSADIDSDWDEEITLLALDDTGLTGLLDE